MKYCSVEENKGTLNSDIYKNIHITLISALIYN